MKLFTRNFTLLILGQVFSLFGNFILKFALSMYILELSGSATIFAGILSVAMIPTIILSPFGGILADRANRRTIMVVLDGLTGFFILCAAIFLSENNAFTVISILLVLLSVLGAFETPTVQACIPSILTGDNITKGNAVVNQVASISHFIAPMLGGILYSLFSLKFMMYISTIFFFITAFLECFIQLHYQPSSKKETILSTIKQDFLFSLRFILKEQTNILKILLFTALSRFFVMGVLMVGLPYIVRTVLALNANYYGVAESALAVATIIGSILAGLFVKKINTQKLSFFLSLIGIFMIPMGLVFLIPNNITLKYVINVSSLCGMQISISIFSIFAVSLIQQKTPNHFIGKMMAYTSAITLCVQPIGQMVYGFLFDHFSIFFILISTGIMVCVIGLLSIRFFKSLETLPE